MWGKRKKVDPSYLFEDQIHPLFGPEPERPVRPIPRARPRPTPPPPEPEAEEPEDEGIDPPVDEPIDDEAPPPWDPRAPEWDEEEEDDEPEPETGSEQEPDSEQEPAEPVPPTEPPVESPPGAPKPVGEIIDEKKRTRKQMIAAAYAYLKDIHREIDWTKFRGMRKPVLAHNESEVWSMAKVGQDKEVTFFRVGTYEGAYLLKRTALGLVMTRYRDVESLGHRIIEDLNAVDAF